MNAELGKSLLYIARSAIAMELGTDVGASPAVHSLVEKKLQEPGAVFVTLTLQGELRGCIGTLQPYRTLAEDCEHNAWGAAFSDDRFAPLSLAEFDEIRIEVSVLGEALPFAFESEEDACDRLRPGVDGVILSYHHHRATFLPQVWTQLPNPRDFLAALKRKAGLDPQFWSPEMELSVYEVEHVAEGEV